MVKFQIVSCGSLFYARFRRVAILSWQMEEARRRYVSSAYLKIRFPAGIRWKSAAMTKYDTGPRPYLWMILAFTSAIDEHSPAYLVQWLRSWKQSFIQLETLSGICSCTILLMNVAWRTLSNTFVKSKDRTWTKSLVDNMVQTVCNRAMTAAVVQPLGLKANLSSKLSPEGGCWSAGG